MTEARITYTAHPGTTAEAELSALAAVYKFVLANKEAAPESRPDDVKEVSNDSRRTASIQQW